MPKTAYGPPPMLGLPPDEVHGLHWSTGIRCRLAVSIAATKSREGSGHHRDRGARHHFGDLPVRDAAEAVQPWTGIGALGPDSKCVQWTHDVRIAANYSGDGIDRMLLRPDEARALAFVGAISLGEQFVAVNQVVPVVR